jgi:lipopolysaccharide/colanic/teichoic acid biosynthesis glycosyltransferase
MPRWLEFLIALGGLICISPLFILIMIAIVIDSPGWPFFFQQRVGKNGKLFWMIKFRKMPAVVPKDGKGITTKNDIRLTRIGRYLERFKMDELPQLINVLIGNMSLVGPRPEITRFTKRYVEKWEKVLSIKPGVIGYNQIKVPHETDLYPQDCMDHEKYYLDHILPNKLDDEIEYISKKNTRFDLYILLNVTLSLITKTFTINWILIHLSQAFILISDTLIGCMSIYLSYLLVHQQYVIPDTIFSNVTNILLISLVIKPITFMFFSLHRYPISSSITLKYLITIMKASLYSCLGVLMVHLFLVERDLVFSAHVVDAFLLPSLLVGVRISYILVHDWLLEMGSLRSFSRALSHILIIVIYGIIGFLTFWLSYMYRTQELNIYVLIPKIWDISICVLIIRSALSIFMWPPKAKTWRSFFGREVFNIFNIALIGTGFILIAYILIGNATYSRSSLAIDYILFTLITIVITLLWCVPQIQAFQDQQPKRVMILGIGIETEMFLSTIHRISNDNLEIVGIITDIEWKRFSSIEGYNVIGTIGDIESLFEVHQPSTLITWEKMTNKPFFPFIEKACHKNGVTISTSPSLDTFFHQKTDNQNQLEREIAKTISSLSN